ncbi:MAG TPA: hypothetical protein VGN12_12040 [Pirellulales bacterium]
MATLKAALKRDYVRCGIASGPHHAEELFRDIERQGAALAVQKRP